ncbi:MAG: FHA domain-containing protein, partial [Planctomycetia bacterium]|nr:FHA domain-containing protein [Planctomycetia bacterium]
MLETQAPAGAKSQDCLTLRVRSRSGLNRTVKVRTRRLTIGSSEDCNLRLRSAGVEDLHCEIRRSGDGVTAHRLSPQTLLNGEEFEEAKLAAGDTLRVGPMEVTVVQTGVADPWEAAAPAFLPEASSMPPSPAHREKEAESGEARSSPAGKTPGPPPCGEARSAPPANRLDALEELCSALQKDQAHVRGQLAQLEAYAALLESQVEALNAQPEKAEAAVGIAESPQPTPQEIQRGLVERLDAVSLSLADVDDKRKAMEEQWESCLKGLRALAQGQSDYREDVNRRLEEIRGQTQLDADARAAWRQESQERIGDWKGLSQRVEAQLERLRQAEAGLAELGGQVRSEVQESRGFWQQRREEWESWLKAAGAERQEGQAQLAALKQAMARCEESVGERCRQTDGALEELRTQQAGLLE